MFPIVSSFYTSFFDGLLKSLNTIIKTRVLAFYDDFQVDKINVNTNLEFSTYISEPMDCWFDKK